MTSEVIYSIHKVSEIIEAELPAQELEIYRSQILAIAEDKILEAQIAVREYQAEVLTAGCTHLELQLAVAIPLDSSIESAHDHPMTGTCPEAVA